MKFADDDIIQVFEEQQLLSHGDIYAMGYCEGLSIRQKQGIESYLQWASEVSPEEFRFRRTQQMRRYRARKAAERPPSNKKRGRPRLSDEERKARERKPKRRRAVKEAA